jgi:hypothetical protein
MSTPPADLGQRLYGMMQYLMAAYAQQVKPEVPDPRNVVQLQDALDAVLQLAAVIDEAAQAAAISADAHRDECLLAVSQRWLAPEMLMTTLPRA